MPLTFRSLTPDEIQERMYDPKFPWNQGHAEILIDANRPFSEIPGAVIEGSNEARARNLYERVKAKRDGTQAPGESVLPFLDKTPFKPYPALAGTVVVVFIVMLITVFLLYLKNVLNIRASKKQIPVSPIEQPTRAVPASVGLRYLAKIVDLAVVLGPALLISTIDQMTAGFIILFGWLTYNWFMVAIWGATLGKLIVGAVIVDKQDSRCGWGRSLGRALLEYTYLLPLVWFISVIALALSKESRSPLDLTAGTRVVRRDSVRHLFAHTTSVPEPPLVSPRTHPDDFEQQIRKLARLRDDGLITATDFEQKKREILGL